MGSDFWRNQVKTQLFYAHNQLAQYRNLPAGSPANYSKALHSGLLLFMRSVWQCWLNEWQTLLLPKTKLATVHSLQSLSLSVGEKSTELSVLKSDDKALLTWVSAFVGLEEQIAPSLVIESNRSESVSSGGAQLGIPIVMLQEVTETKILPASDVDDCEIMLRSLKLLIDDTRAIHEEW